MENNAISVQISRRQTKSEGLFLPLKEVNKAVSTMGGGVFQLLLILKAVPLHLCWVAL